ncbi:recombination regulator RecX [Rossellomorea marisflavi]|uniref:Regulatory protein RecX n=1 Tax=Rossellomorea marisflavi TaxID=189381 RepID=A0A0J5UYT9_9BACI|nr:recombination regulator RecX [Rossellomorea marisflavi]KMK90424.1 hypothetical protein VL03_21795 [Rossellomorea marisflavi]KML07620.1 hypothetical protein VL06_03360 [Rossellomorea marisflavi]KML29992.1 hypothetical protein VL12_18700 [Rossellomorea marisflavi]KZE46537.1 hypothetical protein AV649_21425 [Rossellomorea marisflavi]MCM2605392.1 recombination regulator RecX [Rossellomorea marisflavi]
MGTITKITRQVKNTERYNLFIDGKYAFSVDEGILASHHLRKGLEVDELAISELQYADDVKKAFNKASHYLSYRMRTEKEVRDHLLESEWEDGIVQEVMDKLKELKYTNDAEFAHAFTGTHMNTSDKGPKWISGELRRKGVDARYIEEALEAFSQDQQVEKAAALMEKMLKKYKNDSVTVAKQKIEQNLMRKGYTGSIMKLAWETVDNQRDDDEAWQAVYHQALKAHRKLSTKYEGYDYNQRMKQALYRKGFSMEDIDRAIEEIKNQEA